jgi:hypothetical protein
MLAMQGKRGLEKPPFKLPDFIEATGISEMRTAYVEKVGGDLSVVAVVVLLLQACGVCTATCWSFWLVMQW